LSNRTTSHNNSAFWNILSETGTSRKIHYSTRFINNPIYYTRYFVVII